MCYIMITDKCNMACPHCLFSCSPRKKGQHMSLNAFQKAVTIATEYDSPITIGGGEPTLHPDLLTMLGIASFVSEHPIFMVTNGTCSEKLWNILMEAQSKDKIGLYVSNDIWHNALKRKPWVERDAKRYKLWWGDPATVKHRTLIKVGRAKRNWDKLMKNCELNNYTVTVEKNMACDLPRIAPDGRIWADIPSGGVMGVIDDPKAIDRAFQIISDYNCQI